jgi:NADPH:quinone reductase-like Zn-dependent oxidoreductase
MAKRVRIYKPGGWERLIIEDFVCSDPAADEIKIDVKAAGINFADVCVRQGLYSSAKEFMGWPITPGFEVAGIVSVIGKDVKGFKVGDRIIAGSFFGGYSSQVVTKASYVRKIPEKMDFTVAAGIIVVFLTSYYALYWLARIHPKSTALIHSAAGGIGLSLTQMLKDLNCKVVGVVGSSHKTKIAREYGADEVIDKSIIDLWKEAEKIAPNGFDLIFDPNGISTFRQSYQHLAPCGLMFVYGFQSMLSKTSGQQNLFILARDYLRTPHFNPFNMTKTNRSVLAFNLSYLFERLDFITDGLDFILDKINNKTFKPLPVTTYKFQDVIKAHQAIESGKTGKLPTTLRSGF